MAQKYGIFEEFPDGVILTGKGESLDSSQWKWEMYKDNLRVEPDPQKVAKIVARVGTLVLPTS